MSSVGYHHVEEVMGTTVSIDVRDPVIDRPGCGEVVRWLHHADATFSTYRADSPISRLGRGELTLAEAGAEVRDVLLQCEVIREETGGAFDVLAVPAPNGTLLDPSGLVKGWSLEQAAHILERHGLANFCINAGGDVALRGRPGPALPWRIGIRHSDEPERFASVLELAGPVAVATSATYERGAHIIDPRNGQAVTELASVTVVGPDLTLADAYATAVFVMGVGGLRWLDSRSDYEGMAVTREDEIISTSGFDRWRQAGGQTGWGQGMDASASSHPDQHQRQGPRQRL